MTLGSVDYALAMIIFSLQDNPCQHPLFFLKDTSYADIAAVIEFVYKGEVNVLQSQLASFLKTAELLQVKGLSGDEDEEQVGDDVLFCHFRCVVSNSKLIDGRRLFYALFHEQCSSLDH